MAQRKTLRILLISNHRRFKINFRADPWARELARRGHEVDVMCHADTERWRTRAYTKDGYRLIENPDLLVGALRQGWDPVCAWRRGRMLFREGKRYDIIHCLDTRPAVILPGLVYGRAKGITILSDWIDWWGRGGLIRERRPLWYRILFGWFETFFEERFRNKLDGLTAISQALVDRAVVLGVPRDRCLRIPGGANTEVFQDAPSKAESRRWLEIADNIPVICFSGLDVLIDLPVVVRVYEQVRATFGDLLLLLVGPRTSDIRQMISSESSMAGIKATGPVPYEQLPRYLAAADVFVMPYTNKISNVGRWPNKIGDYMCMARPTVSNPVGEVKWLFEKYDVGVLVDEDPAAMADAVIKLLRDPARAKAIGEAARVVAENEFPWSRLIVQLENWYYAMLERVA